MGDILIREVRESDVDALLSIYAPYVEQTAITFEYEVPTREDFLGRIRKTTKKYPYIVAVKGGEIVGYAYAGAFVGRAAYDWSAEASIYVHMNHRKEGIGGKLYIALEQMLKEMHILNINACIGVPAEGMEDEHLDHNSESFHEHLGYRLVGRFHNSGYKFETWYDMIWMEKMLGDHPEHPESVIPCHKRKIGA